jgi:hypothetical protein
MLCGGDRDPEVYFLNTQPMQAYWTAHAPVTAPISVPGFEHAEYRRRRHSAIWL